MPGNWTITTRSDGEVLTAAKYNADNQKAVDNSIPASIDDYSADAATMRTTADPGEVGTESLATSLAEEITRLRFAIKEIRGGAQWYVTNATRVENLGFNFTNETDGNTEVNLLDGKSIYAESSWLVPSHYVSGDATFTFYVSATVTGNTIALRKYVFRARSGSAFTTPSNGVNIDISPANTNVTTITYTVAAADFQAGDIVLVELERLGGDASDTNTGHLDVWGVTVSYTGIASRT